MKKLKRLGEWVLEANPLVPLLIALTVATIAAIILIETFNFLHRSKCLDSSNSRRWHNGICEEYYNREWIEIDPVKKIKVYYNNPSKVKQ